MKTIPDFSAIFITPFMFDCNEQRCCVLLVLQQQNATAPYYASFPINAIRQQSCLRAFSCSSLILDSGFRHNTHFAFKCVRALQLGAENLSILFQTCHNPLKSLLFLRVVHKPRLLVTLLFRHFQLWMGFTVQSSKCDLRLLVATWFEPLEPLISS